MANPNPKRENLKPFKKGNKANPNGRPKKIPELDKLLAEVLGEQKDGVTAMEVIIKALRQKAIKGDIRAGEVLLNRAYGKPKETIDNRVTIEKPLIIDWTQPTPDIQSDTQTE